MREIKQRLEKGVAVLARLEQRRQETRTPLWGYETEFLIISHELRQLESDIIRDPGALESHLVRLPRIPPSEAGPDLP
ncbi:MAG: hypothetical protein LAP87_06340 [Acidobacteriia bacterium]|nr:hypothetical protein [Terriglobia bacterium]